MATALEDVLGYVPLTGLIQKVETGIPEVVPPAFWDSRNRTTTIKDVGRYTVTRGTRQTARRVDYDSPALKRELSSVGSQDVKLPTFYEYTEFNHSDFMLLREYNSPMLMKKGRDELDRQVLEFKQKFDNLSVAMVHSMLALGKIHFDSSGNLLYSSSGADVTIDFGIPSANRDQVSGVIAASWDTASTDIPSHVRGLKKYMRQLCGKKPKYAFYGSAVPGMLQKNDYLKDWWVRYQKMNEAYLDTTDIPPGFLGLIWVPAYEAFYSDSTATIREWFGSDQITLIPEIDQTVYEYMDGSFYVPKSFEPQPSIQAALDSSEEVTDLTMWAEPITNPMRAKLFCKRVGVPIWKNENAMLICDVKP